MYVHGWHGHPEIGKKVLAIETVRHVPILIFSAFCALYVQDIRSA